MSQEMLQEKQTGEIQEREDGDMVAEEETDQQVQEGHEVLDHARQGTRSQTLLLPRSPALHRLSRGWWTSSGN